MSVPANSSLALISSSGADLSTFALKEGAPLDASLLTEITEKEIQELKATFVEKYDLTTFDWTLAEFFLYEGFDAALVYRHVLAVQKKFKMTQAQFNEELSMLLCLQILRGNVTVSNFSTFSDKGRATVSNAFSRWSLSLKIDPKKKRSAVTLPRLSLAFPFQAAIISQKIGKNFIGPFKSTDLPNFMKTNSFASLIPLNTPFTQMLTFAYNCFSSDQTLSLTRKNMSNTSGEEMGAVFDKQLVFTDIAIQSDIMSPSARRECMRFFKVRDYYKVISDIIKASIKSPESLSFVLSASDWDSAFGIFLTTTSAPS